MLLLCFSSCSKNADKDKSSKIGFSETFGSNSLSVQNETTNKKTINDNTTDKSNKNAETLSDFEKNLITNALGEDAEFKGYDQLSEDEKSSIKEAAKKDGTDVSFDDDVMIVKNEDGELEYGNVTVDEELIFDLIPAPEVGKITMKGTVAEGEYALLIVNISAEQAKQYTETLKKAGFRKNIEEDSEDGGFVFYAENSDGSSVEVSHFGSMIMINLVK